MKTTLGNVKIWNFFQLLQPQKTFPQAFANKYISSSQPIGWLTFPTLIGYVRRTTFSSSTGLYWDAKLMYR